MNTIKARNHYLCLTLAIALIGCLSGRPAAAQTDPIADTELGTEDAETGVADAELGTLNTTAKTIDGHIVELNGTIIKQLGFPGTSVTAAIGSDAVTGALETSTPTAVQADAQVIGVIGPDSTAGDTLAREQKGAITTDVLDVKDGAEVSVEKRINNTINGVGGNAIKSLGELEEVGKGLADLKSKASSSTSLADAADKTNTMLAILTEEMNKEDVDLNNNTIATETAARAPIEADMAKRSDIVASIALLGTGAAAGVLTSEASSN